MRKHEPMVNAPVVESESNAKAHEVWLEIARYSDKRCEGIIAAALEAERKAGREEGIAQSYSQGFRDVRREARQAALEEAAKIAENTPIDIFRSQTHEGLRLSIADRIRRLGEK